MVETIIDGDVSLYADFDNRYLRQAGRAGVERGTLTTLPVIDIAPFVTSSDAASRARVARQIRAAAIDIGFFYITGHGFTPAEIDALLNGGRRFFALPMAEKTKIHWNNSPGKGYVPPGGLNPNVNPDAAPDMKERLYFAREFALSAAEYGTYKPGASQWLDENTLPGFRVFLEATMRKSVALTQQLGRAFAQSLDLPEPYFDDTYGRSGVTLVYNYYPPLDPATLDKTQWSFSPHTDYGTFTFVIQDRLGGLQVRNAAGRWIDVTPVEGALIVNIGDLLALATNDLYTSNLHRVANFNRQERLSVSFFVSPPGDATVSCLPTCQGPNNPARYDPVIADEYVKALIEQYHRTGRPGIAVQTASRFRPQ
jgi:isopenicillin N synthase-like dioxygenase